MNLEGDKKNALHRIARTQRISAFVYSQSTLKLGVEKHKDLA
jgi:hypothetical protein